MYFKELNPTSEMTVYRKVHRHLLKGCHYTCTTGTAVVAVTLDLSLIYFFLCP